MKISEKSNGRIKEKWLKFPPSHSDQRNRSLNFTSAFFRRFKDLEPMLALGKDSTPSLKPIIMAAVTPESNPVILRIVSLS